MIKQNSKDLNLTFAPGTSAGLARRELLIGAASLGLTTSVSKASPQAEITVQWDQVRRLATAFVEQESPDSAFPFKRTSPDVLAAMPKKVIIHYFPFFVLSYENDALDRDHWTQFLSAGGEEGKWAFAGGYTRERPLSPAPWHLPYWRELNAAIDVLRAKLIGADGFGIDLVTLEPAPAPNQAKILFDAAASVAPDFHIALEPDTAILSAATPADLARTIESFANSPALFRTEDGRILLVPFAANNKPPEYWSNAINQLDAAEQHIALLPDLLGLGVNVERFAPISIGMSFWGPRDPVSATSATLLAAENRARSLGLWMQPIAPQDARPKDSVFWEAANTRLFRTLWMQAIEQNASYAHILTWNDYSETTELEPSSGTQFLYYDLAAYYIDWFKVGKPPIIFKDAIYYCHRTQIFNPNMTYKVGRAPFRNLGMTPLQNDIEMIAFLTAPATLEISINESRHSEHVAAGLATIRTAAQFGRPKFRIYRNGVVVLEKLSDWAIDPAPTKANPAYFGGSTTRTFRQSFRPLGE